ncbi:Uncharacterised protein [Yersinia pekkanenii]|uniref:Uncharacterized protein n=1 Tax=Yersinia pekkanenii TaxID=1288385 RepID=A0A0T9RQK9_9GAMM|nr:Uncharacterised protein [Yersinia pekkanenii]
MLLPLALLANVRPARLVSAVPVTVLKMTWFNVRLTPVAFEKAAPVPFRLRIKSVNTWLLLVPAKVSPVAVPVAVIVPPTRFNSALVSTLTPVPAVALRVPPVLSTLTVCTGVELTVIPDAVLLMVPLFATLIVAVPVLVADIPVAAFIVPSLSSTIGPVPLCVAEIPVAAVMAPAERM